MSDAAAAAVVAVVDVVAAAEAIALAAVAIVAVAVVVSLVACESFVLGHIQHQTSDDEPFDPAASTVFGGHCWPFAAVNSPSLQRCERVPILVVCR